MVALLKMPKRLAGVGPEASAKEVVRLRPKPAHQIDLTWTREDRSSAKPPSMSSVTIALQNNPLSRERSKIRGENHRAKGDNLGC